MFSKNKLSIIGLFAVLLALVAYYFGLFVDLTGDAGKYAAIARHIVESGDFIHLKIHGAPYEQKPPLIFWLAAVGFKLGGFTNFGYKLFLLLYGFLGVFFTYKLGKSLYNKFTGQLAASFLFFSEFCFLYSMDIHTDLLLQTNVALALWQLWEYLKYHKIKNFIWAFIGIGLAMMSKGPIGGAVPAFALGTYLILQKKWRELFHPKWIAGILIALIVASPAFIGLIDQFGLQGIKFFFWTNNIGRISGSYVGNNTDYLFYIHTMLYMYTPWALLLFAALVMEFKVLRKKDKPAATWFVHGAIWIYFVIISCARGKAPNYIFILVPLFSVLTARWTAFTLDHPAQKGLKTLQVLQNITLALGWLFTLTVMIYLFPSSNRGYWLILVLTIAATIYVFTQKKQATAKLILPSILMMSLLQFYMNSYAFPYMFSYQASSQAARIYNAKAGKNAKIYNYLYGQYELFFYAKDDAIEISNSQQLKQALEKSGSWIFTTQAGMDTINLIHPPNIEVTYRLKHRGMNRIGGKFIFPPTRQQSLQKMYLIKTQ